jgi:ATP-dependent DNA helicase RecG
MAISEKEIQFILKQGEGYNIEFKKSASNTIAQEVCAFVNSAGGKLLNKSG